MCRGGGEPEGIGRVRGEHAKVTLPPLRRISPLHGTVLPAEHRPRLLDALSAVLDAALGITTVGGAISASGENRELAVRLGADLAPSMRAAVGPAPGLYDLAATLPRAPLAPPMRHAMLEARSGRFRARVCFTANAPAVRLAVGGAPAGDDLVAVGRGTGHSAVVSHAAPLPPCHLVNAMIRKPLRPPHPFWPAAGSPESHKACLWPVAGSRARCGRSPPPACASSASGSRAT